MIKREYTDFINDINIAIGNIENFVSGIDYETFKINIMVHKAVIRCLEEIGEAVKNIPDEIKKSYPEIPWKEAAGLRDKLIHFYWGTDLEIVWNVIKFDIADLKKSIRESSL